MAIKGIGVDVVELARITDVVEKHPNFGMRLFTEKERARAFEPQRDIAAIAARFAVKEAVSKALGTGIGSIGWKEIETTSAGSGAPVVTLYGNAAKRAELMGVTQIHASISHERSVAVAMIILEG